MPEEIDEQDVDILLSSLDAWLARDATTSIIEEIMVATATSPMQAAMTRERIDTRKRKRALEKSAEEEKVILLKAKLVGIRRRILEHR